MRKNKSVSLSLSLELLERIDAVCRADFLGRSEAVEDLLWSGLTARSIKEFEAPPTEPAQPDEEELKAFYSAKVPNS